MCPEVREVRVAVLLRVRRHTCVCSQRYKAAQDACKEFFSSLDQETSAKHGIIGSAKETYAQVRQRQATYADTMMLF